MRIRGSGRIARGGATKRGNGAVVDSRRSSSRSIVHKGAVGAAGERNRKCAACIGAAEEKLGAPSHTQVAGACLEAPGIDSGGCGGGCFSVSLFRRTLETAVYRLSRASETGFRETATEVSNSRTWNCTEPQQRRNCMHQWIGELRRLTRGDGWRWEKEEQDGKRTGEVLEGRKVDVWVEDGRDVEDAAGP